MRRAIITALGIYLVSIAIFWFLYYREPRAVDWHHLFAYLTLIGFTVLSITGALMRSEVNGRYKDLHVIAAISTSVTLIIAVLMYRYAMLY